MFKSVSVGLHLFLAKYLFLAKCKCHHAALNIKLDIKVCPILLNATIRHSNIINIKVPDFLEGWFALRYKDISLDL